MTSPVVFADFFDGRSAIRRVAQVRLDGSSLVVEFDLQRRHYAAHAVRVASVPGVATRFISLPDGGELHCGVEPFLEALPPDSKSGVLAARLGQTWWAALGGVVLLVLGLGFALIIAVPRAVDAAVARISWQTEVRIGRKATELMFPGGREQSHLPFETRAVLRARFREFSQGLPLSASYRLAFMPSPVANAYAFPGGNIVLTDALVKECSSDEVLAFIAHEIGHVEHRHPLRQVARGAAVSALLGLLAADVSNVSVGAVLLSETLTKTRYSRQFESEADQFAFALLRQRHLSPSLFADCLERLSGPAGSGGWEFLSSHPASEARVANARSAPRP